MNDTYPAPKSGRSSPKVVVRNETPEFGNTRDEFEERIFRTADHFNVIRYGVPAGSECATVATFPEAMALAHNNPRVLVYVVSTTLGHAFCMGRKDYNRYAEIWLSMSNRKS
jgi:hypothetical protein